MQEVELMDSMHKQKPATNEITFNKPQWEKKTYAKDKKKMSPNL